jgi:FkbM family methyltransferase
MYWLPSAYRCAIEFAFGGGYEEETRLLFERLLRPGMFVVDLGASLGYYTLLAAKKVGNNGRVYAFEPQPWNCEVIRKSIHANAYEGIVIIIQKAVADKQGLVTLHFAEPGSGEASLYWRSMPGRGQQSIAVEATTLDEFFEKEGSPPIHVMKMDIEGAEKAALEGAKALIQRNTKLKLIIEFDPRCQADAGVSPEEFFNTLIGVGFKNFSVIQKELQPVKIPNDIRRLVKMAGDSYINLLCEK